MQDTQLATAAPAPCNDPSVDFFELHRLVGDGSVASMDFCLMAPAMYRQYQKFPLQRRRTDLWQLNSLRGIGDMLAMNIAKVSRALHSAYERFLEWQHRGAAHLDCQSIGAIDLTRELTEACRSVLRYHGGVPAVSITDDDVARKTAGFYLMHAISRGLLTVTEIAEALHWTPRQTRAQLSKREADGEVTLWPSGDVKWVHPLKPGELAAKHGKTGYCAQLRERHFQESEAYIEEIGGRGLAQAAVRRDQQERAAKRRSAAARRRYYVDKVLASLQLKPYRGLRKTNRGGLSAETALAADPRRAPDESERVACSPETLKPHPSGIFELREELAEGKISNSNSAPPRTATEVGASFRAKRLLLAS